MGNTWSKEVFETASKKSPKIIANFKYLWLLIIIYSVFGTYSIVSGNSLQSFFWSKGVLFGRMALVLLGFVVLPGILGRFGIEIKLTRIITLFRRQLGITVFLLAFTHYHFVRGLPRYLGIIPFKPPFPLFETLGMAALFILFLMFLTSNNFSVKKLGKWWKRLHRFVYVVIWLLVLHTGLQRMSVWTFFIGTFAILEVTSFVWEHFKKKAI